MVLDWLDENRLRFNHPPCLVEEGENSLIFKFSGIAPEVILAVMKYGAIDIHIDDQGSSWDIAAEFSVYRARTENGLHYCSGCLPEERKYYPSLSALIYQHGLEPLLNWANETFQKTKWIGLFRYKGATWVKIIEEGDLPAINKDPHFVHGFPVVQT
jgi:hypothetical protein